MVAAQLALIVAGALAELVGIALAVWEVRQRREYVQEYRIGLQTVYGRARGSATSSTMAAISTVTEGEPPTVEQRLTALEAALGAVRGEVSDAERRAVETAKAHASEVAGDALQDAQREVGEVRALLLRVTEPNWQVWTSLALLLLGLALQSLASALGVDAPAGAARRPDLGLAD